MKTVTLTGAALKAEATRLAIPGRSKMTAGQLREAVTTTLATLATAATETTPDGDLQLWTAGAASRSLSDRHGTPVPDQRPAPRLSTPAPVTPAVFAARWGKRKPSLNGRIRRSGH